MQLYNSFNFKYIKKLTVLSSFPSCFHTREGNFSSSNCVINNVMLFLLLGGFLSIHQLQNKDGKGER